MRAREIALRASARGQSNKARLDIQTKQLARLAQRVRELERAAAVPKAATLLSAIQISSEERLATAITSEHPVMFRYRKEGERNWELRQLSPYELIKVQRGAVVRGWDHQREAIRSFRLDRMEGVSAAPGVSYREPRTDAGS